jgi:hypothetical protein
MTELFDTYVNSILEACWKKYKKVGMKKKGKKMVPDCVLKTAKSKTVNESWQDEKHKNPSGGMKKSGVDAYRRENPGSKLQTAVTTDPSKLKKDSKPAKRRKSFCSRMRGMKKKLTSAKTANDPDSRINKSLRKWNC